MAFKYQVMRRDFLVRDILFMLLGHESVVKDISGLGGKSIINNQALVDVSVDLADRLWNATHVYQEDTKTDLPVDDPCSLSPIVLDGELGDL